MHSKRMTKERLASMRTRKEVLVADVRTPEHFRDGSINGSVNLFPTRNFVNRLQTIQNKNQPIVIVSDILNDEESRASQMYAERMGFSNIFTAEFKSLKDD